MADRQPQSGAPIFPSNRNIRLGKLLEEGLLLLQADTDTGVGYLEPNR